MHSHFLNLPFLMPGQSLKHVSLNTQLSAIDALLFCAVSGVDISVLPANPEEGKRILIASSPEMSLEEHASAVAIFVNGKWDFFNPAEGWQVWSTVDSDVYIFDGSSWISKSRAADLGGYTGRLENLEAVGIGTSADANSALVVRGPNTLFDSSESHRFSINRSDVADTASIIFQTDYSGQAEIGLTDEENLSIRMSSDGENWVMGPRIDTDGVLSAPAYLSNIIEIPRDDIAEIEPVKDHGIIAFTLKWGVFPQAACAGLLSFDIGSSPLLVTLSLGPKANNLGVTNLTGTTGPDDELNVAIRQGVIQFENRINTTVEVSYSMIV